jgi:hypothetical protein
MPQPGRENQHQTTACHGIGLEIQELGRGLRRVERRSGGMFLTNKSGGRPPLL